MPRPKRAERPSISEEHIYRNALELVDKEGIDALSMRRLASSLQVDPMTLYYYVPNKERLLRGVYDLVLSELPLDRNSAKAWQTRLRKLARDVRALAHKHPRLFAHLLVTPSISEHEFEIFEELYRLLHEAGLAPNAIVQASRTLFAFIAGFALLEVNGTLCQLSLGEEAALETLSEARFPHTIMLKPELKHFDPAADFEFGLELLLQGLQR